MIVLTVQETPERCGRFSGHVDGEQIVASTRQPFLDAARVLLARGVDPATLLQMRHERTGTDSVRGPVGEAAKLRVLEKKAGGAPRFAPFTGGHIPDKE